ncbi:putative flavonol 3-sulfotransferase [Medicago truncatula]|uniref:Sulfotransferase n=1 Tax=Medicago truncatula TaxID=3880 RepID=A0A396IS14_MEDTR|nr:putative flavonol 3-sulfotransferase [Medicago truncatula]
MVLFPFWSLIFTTKILFLDVKTLSSSRLFSTHLSYELLPKSVKESTCKVVYLCRDPKDTFVSLWHFTNNLRAQSRGTLPLQEAFENFCRGVSSFGPFWEHVLVYWKKSLERPEKVMFLKYEEMKMKPNFYLKELAEFLECPFSKEEEFKGVVDDILNLCSFEKLSNLEVNKIGKGFLNMENKAFFRLGNIGDWKNHLTTEMVEQINTIAEEKFVKHGLCF